MWLKFAQVPYSGFYLRGPKLCELFGVKLQRLFYMLIGVIQHQLVGVAPEEGQHISSIDLASN